jgi:ribosomal protein L11 methyltransferase
LAVAAAKLGAGEVLALDTDADAVAVARESVSLNSLAGMVEVGRGGIESAVPLTTWWPRTSSPPR